MEFLFLLGRLREMPDALIQRRAEALLEGFGLANERFSRLGTFSKGMRQKVLLSSALLHDPDVLFLDEPLSGLDVESTVLVKELLAALATAKKTVFYCSHVMDVVERVCDRILILDGGRIVADGSFAELAGPDRDTSLEDVFGRLTGQGDPTSRIEMIIQALGDD